MHIYLIIKNGLVRSELGQGKLYRLEGVVAHHFCLLFATPLLQVIHITTKYQLQCCGFSLVSIRIRIQLCISMQIRIRIQTNSDPGGSGSGA
jgi:hypothetical protein